MASLTDQTYDREALGDRNEAELNKRVKPLPPGKDINTVGDWPVHEGRLPAAMPADVQGTEGPEGGNALTAAEASAKQPAELGDVNTVGGLEAGFGTSENQTSDNYNVVYRDSSDGSTASPAPVTTTSDAPKTSAKK